jgi:hypothetical protein
MTFAAAGHTAAAPRGDRPPGRTPRASACGCVRRRAVLPAAHNDDDGVVQGDDVIRTFLAVFVVMVARWSSRCRVVVVELAGVIVTVAPGREHARARQVPILSRWAGAAAASG